MGQLGFFDPSRRHECLDAKNDPRVAIAALVPWECFWPKPGAALINGELRASAAARRRGEARADTYIGGIAAGCLSLSIFPERGTMRDDIRPELRTKAYAKRVTIAFPVNGLDRDRCDSRRVLWRAGFRAVAP
jgi:plasmid stabilization system protein ParE